MTTVTRRASPTPGSRFNGPDIGFRPMIA